MEDDPDRILYSAVSILRQDMSEYKTTSEYPSPAQVSLFQSNSSMPPRLSRFVNWLVDSHSFESNNDEYSSNENIIRKCTAITETIISASRKVITPLQIGLAVQLYHDFGSRQLIDTLHAHGFCADYDEVQ